MRLENIARVVGGSTAPQNKKFYEDGKYLFVRVSDLGARKNFTPLINTRDKLNEEGIKRSKLVLVPKDTIVFPKSGAAILTNSRGILGKDAFIVNHLAGIIALKNKSHPRYLLFYLSKLDMRKYISPDSSYPSLKLETIKNLKIPIPFRNGKPDLEIQKRIAGYIDETFSMIDAILEKKKEFLKQLDELWESVLDQTFKPKEGEDWREVRLVDLIKERPRYGLTAKAKDKGKFVFLRITDIDDKGDIKNSNFKFIDLEKYEVNKYDIKRGDLLLARSGSVGSYFIAFEDYPNWVYASYLIRFRLDINKTDLKFIKYFLSSHNFKKWVSFQKRPGAQPNINAKEYSSFKIPIPFRNNHPDLERQKEIANYLDGVYEKIKTLKEKIQNQITQLEEIKESILDEVFNHDQETNN